MGRYKQKKTIWQFDKTFFNVSEENKLDCLLHKYFSLVLFASKVSDQTNLT
jgi:hypothetical protein